MSGKLCYQMQSSAEKVYIPETLHHDRLISTGGLAIENRGLSNGSGEPGDESCFQDGFLYLVGHRE